MRKQPWPDFVEVDGVRFERRADLQGMFGGPVYAAGEAGSIMFRAAVRAETGQILTSNVTREIEATLSERLAKSKRETARQLDDRLARLAGETPRKPARRRGSRGPKFRGQDLAAVPVQLLADWFERGRITEPMLRAGNRFHCEIMAAHEPCLSAAPLAKVIVDGSARPGAFPRGAGAAGSQEIVYGALDACGGINSASGSVVWHVLGMEKTLRAWDREHNHFAIARAEIPGLLYGALERLQKHYGFRARKKDG